jgi:hypothetical protein
MDLELSPPRGPGEKAKTNRGSDLRSGGRRADRWRAHCGEKNSGKCELPHRWLDTSALNWWHDQEFTKAIAETVQQRQCRLCAHRHQRSGGLDRTDLPHIDLIRVWSNPPAIPPGNAPLCSLVWAWRRKVQPPMNFIKSFEKNTGSVPRLEIASSAMRHDPVSSTGKDSNRA